MSGTGSVGIGEVVLGEATAEGGDGNYTWTWDFGDGTGRTTYGPTSNVRHVYSSLNIYTVTVTLTDGDLDSANVDVL